MIKIYGKNMGTLPYISYKRFKNADFISNILDKRVNCPILCIKSSQILKESIYPRDRNDHV